MPGARVTLRTDISQFYPSIYTHAVDWAIRGKATAKRSKHGSHLGNILDKQLRESRDRQTAGISIGPDTSWVVAEVLLGRIDERLVSSKTYGEWVSHHGYRFGDDMTVFARSLDQAEQILGDYENILADYELSLNPLKVAIADYLIPPVPPWVSRLRQMRYRSDTENNLASDIVDIFTEAFNLVREYPGDGVLSYAIKRCDPFPAGRVPWGLYRDFILASAMQDASTLPHIYQVLTFARDHHLPTRDDSIGEILNQICLLNAPLNRGFEVAWAITILRTLGLPLDGDAATAVAKMTDNCSLVLLAQEVRRLRLNTDLTQAQARAATEGALFSADWLLAYEFRLHRLCPPRRWDRADAWKELYQRRVSFVHDPEPDPGRLRRRRPSYLPSWGGS